MNNKVICLYFLKVRAGKAGDKWFLILKEKDNFSGEANVSGEKLPFVTGEIGR